MAGSTIFASALYAPMTQPVYAGTENVAGYGFQYSSQGEWGRALTTDATYLYWTTYNGQIQRNTVVAPIAAPTTLVTGESSGTNGSALASIVVDANYIYWTDTVLDLIRRAPIAGGAGQTVSTANEPTNVVLSGGFLYWGATLGGDISRISTTADAGAAEVVIGNASAPVAIAVDASNVYWIDGANLWRANLDGTGVLELAIGYTDLVDLGVDDTYVFFVEQGGAASQAPWPGTIWRVAKYVTDRLLTEPGQESEGAF